MQRIGLLWTSSLSRTGIHSRKAECLSICRDAFLLAIYGFLFHHRTETQSLQRPHRESCFLHSLSAGWKLGLSNTLLDQLQSVSSLNRNGGFFQVSELAGRNAYEVLCPHTNITPFNLHNKLSMQMFPSVITFQRGGKGVSTACSKPVFLMPDLNTFLLPGFLLKLFILLYFINIKPLCLFILGAPC